MLAHVTCVCQQTLDTLFDTEIWEQVQRWYGAKITHTLIPAFNTGFLSIRKRLGVKV